METHGGFHPPQSSPSADRDENAAPRQIGLPAKGVTAETGGSWTRKKGKKERH